MFRKQNLAAIPHPKSPDRLVEGSSGPIRMNRIVHGGRQRETTAGKFSHDNLWLRASRVTTLRNEYKRLGKVLICILLVKLNSVKNAR
jgi:hypothetical protein